MSEPAKAGTEFLIFFFFLVLINFSLVYFSFIFHLPETY